MLYLDLENDTAFPSRASIFEECFLAKDRVPLKQNQDHFSQ